MFTKSDDGVLDYQIDYSAWLTSSGGDTIATSVWVVPSDLVKDSDTNDATTTTVVLSGGTAGTTYKIENTVTTAGGRVDERCFDLFVSACR